MATTVEDLIKSSLKEIVVAGDEASVPAIEAQDYIFKLNNLVAEFESDSTVDLTFTTVTSVADELTVPAGLIRPLAILMAKEMTESFGAETSPDFKRMALDAVNTVLRIATTRTGAYKPSTLPIGSGNESFSSINERFYSGSE